MAVEQLKPVRSVTWHRWSQAPMQTATGQVQPSNLSRVVAAYEGGGDLTVNEYDRTCAEKLALDDRGGLRPAGDRRGSAGRAARRKPTISRPDGAARDHVWARGSRRSTTWPARSRSPSAAVCGARSAARCGRTRYAAWSWTTSVKGPVETFTVWAIVGLRGGEAPARLVLRLRRLGRPGGVARVHARPRAFVGGRGASVEAQGLAPLRL